MWLDCKGKRLDLSQPVVMGILNVTPDSFSDGGLHFSTENAVRRAEQMYEEGAAIIDVGGESTRPGAALISAQEEIDRVLPVLEKIVRLPIPISIDTSKPEVMRAAIHAGAGMINDVRALRVEGALNVAVESGAAICLMHMRGEPSTMQQSPHYEDVVHEVRAFLVDRVAHCYGSGIAKSRILIDPGFGFGKTLAHNLKLLQAIGRLTDVGAGVLVGISRKSMVGLITGGAMPPERLNGSIAAAVIAAWQGARVIRTHDVRPTVQALQVCAAVQAAGTEMTGNG